MIEHSPMDEEMLLMREKLEKLRIQNSQLLFFGDFCSTLLSETNIEKISLRVMEQMHRLVGGNIGFVRKEASADQYASYILEKGEIRKHILKRSELGSKCFFIYCKKIYVGNEKNPFIAVPIKYEGENLGVVMLENLDEDSFRAVNIKHLELIALPIGVAVKNCLLLQQSILEKHIIADQHQKIQEDLRFAQKIQSYLMPRGFRKYGDYMIYGDHKQARYLGGDFYDTFQIDQQRVVFYIADVSGHGVAASLLTVFLKQAVRGIVQSFPETYKLKPSAILEKLQIRFRDLQMDETVYIGTLVGILDFKRHLITLANAGHNVEPVYLDPNNQQVITYELKGPPINNWEIDHSLLSYEETAISLEKEEQLILLTDGAIEMDGSGSAHKNIEDTDFIKRILEIKPQQEWKKEFQAKIHSLFEGLDKTHMEDDIALLAIKREV
ncbi:Stage II sporulation protein E (SpoIIE) [Geosporobacter subterraneus DSM 17957]|uniref:Stage II sporulation protein E (SpoIIE) n=1 Tax=Geosporobacter subterraneus DSM 17957 TaxID=1121919 RepID=A0A1M6EUB4_9FIRM|nr:SpoIIE family protein phosphatase [Geosporobacter subterraneus]SHI88998.1 Stage II sporulation protein E (SpoIIE) [Geosporobacter subterraneus DSM 17957]